MAFGLYEEVIHQIRKTGHSPMTQARKALCKKSISDLSPEESSQCFLNFALTFEEIKAIKSQGLKTYL
jgi:hypothetical protein